MVERERTDRFKRLGSTNMERAMTDSGGDETGTGTYWIDTIGEMDSLESP